MTGMTMVIEKAVGLAQRPELLVGIMGEVNLRSQAHDLIDWALLTSDLTEHGTPTNLNLLPQIKLRTVLLGHQIPHVAQEICLMAFTRCLM